MIRSCSGFGVIVIAARIPALRSLLDDLTTPGAQKQRMPDLNSEAIDFRAASELSAPYRQMTVQAWNALRILTMARSATTADPQGAPRPSGTNHWRTASFRQGPVRPVPGCLDPGGSLCRNKSNASVSRYVTLPRAFAKDPFCASISHDVERNREISFRDLADLCFHSIGIFRQVTRSSSSPATHTVGKSTPGKRAPRRFL